MSNDGRRIEFSYPMVGSPSTNEGAAAAEQPDQVTVEV